MLLSFVLFFCVCPSIHHHHDQFTRHGDKVSEKTEQNVRNLFFVGVCVFCFATLEMMQHSTVFEHLGQKLIVES